MIFATRAPRSCTPKASIFRRSRICWHSLIGVTRAIYIDVLREVQRDAVDRLGHLFGSGDETDT